MESTRLTKRQRQTIVLVAKGLSNVEIGRALEIAPRTVDKHIANVFESLAVRSRTGALCKLGWVTIPEDYI